MRSVKPGSRTSVVEVTNISKRGLWLFLRDREIFLSFDRFPWFRDAPIGAILDVHLPHAGHLHWPQLDVDLAVESIDHPERFPLVSRIRPHSSRRPARRPDGKRGSDSSLG